MKWSVLPPEVLETCPPPRLVRTGSRGTRGALPIAIRWAGFIPYFKMSSYLLLPEAFSFPAVIALALTHAVFSHEISMALAAERRAGAGVGAPLRGACLLFGTLLLALPALCYLLSPESCGGDLARLPEHLPAFGLLVLPCCAFFAVAQWRVHSHNQLLFRLGLLALAQPSR